jgi:hypothetical protein
MKSAAIVSRKAPKIAKQSEIPQNFSALSDSNPVGPGKHSVGKLVFEVENPIN